MKLLVLNLKCRRWFELSSDVAGGWKALPGGDGYPRNEGGGEAGQVALVEEYILDKPRKYHKLKIMFWTTMSSLLISRTYF